MHDEERDEQAETFNQDQQEMFQNPDTSPGETRPPTPGEQNAPATSDLDRGPGHNTDEQVAE